MRIVELLHLLKDIETACSTCNRCGMCQSVCPVFLQSKYEGDVARGKLALLDGLSREILTRPDRVLDRLNRCLLCGACERCCSRNVPLVEIFIKARVMITTYTGLNPLKKVIFRFVLTRPALFETIVTYLSRLQGLFLNTASPEKNVKITRGIIPSLKGRHVLPLPHQSFRKELKTQGGADKKQATSRRVVFFTGCLIDKLMPQVGHACLQVLKKAGMTVLFINDEACCGIPALASGDSLAFQQLRGHNLARLQALDFDVLVTACATCTSTITAQWPMMDDKKNDSLTEFIRDVAGRTMDITEFVMTHGQGIVEKIVPIHENTLPISITFHDPCHLKGKGQALAFARRLLASLPGYDVVEMDKPGLCCGSGGSFNLSHYDLSRQIGQEKIRSIVSSGASQVVTACPGCMLQLTDMLAREGSPVRVRHIMELLAESLGFPSEGK
ncbi:MAG: (Fe-S)-binding protein [Proteobacteria bacterium]|nr:(Fe-S)-binding protein [Pseudomonadota bacterium]